MWRTYSRILEELELRSSRGRREKMKMKMNEQNEKMEGDLVFILTHAREEWGMVCLRFI